MATWHEAACTVAPPNGLELSKIPRLWREAARRKPAALPYSTARQQAEQASIELQPAGRRSPAFFPGGQPKVLPRAPPQAPRSWWGVAGGGDLPGPKVPVHFQGFSELSAGPQVTRG